MELYTDCITIIDNYFCHWEDEMVRALQGFFLLI